MVKVNGGCGMETWIEKEKRKKVKFPNVEEELVQGLKNCW